MIIEAFERAEKMIADRDAEIERLAQISLLKETEIGKLIREVERLQAALKPFADAANDAEGYPDDHPLGCDPQMELATEIEEGAWAPLKIAHLRHAAKALGNEH